MSAILRLLGFAFLRCSPPLSCGFRAFAGIGALLPISRGSCCPRCCPRPARGVSSRPVPEQSAGERRGEVRVSGGGTVSVEAERVLDERLVTNIGLLVTMASTGFFGAWGVVGHWWGFVPGIVAAVAVPTVFVQMLSYPRSRRLLLRLADRAITPTAPRGSPVGAENTVLHAASWYSWSSPPR